MLKFPQVQWSCSLLFQCLTQTFLFVPAALANEEDMEAFFSDVVRYRPQELSQLASVTKFSRREIQHIYRGFKQVREALVVSLLSPNAA